MAVQTDSERVRLSRRLVLEFLASSVDLSLAPAVADYLQRYGARPERFGAPEAGKESESTRLATTISRIEPLRPPWHSR